MVVMCTCGGVDGGDLYYAWCVGSHPPQRGHTWVRVTHPYVEVLDHSDA